MANMLNPLLPYILQEALGVYKQRAGTAGRSVGNFDMLAQLLGQNQQTFMRQAQPIGGPRPALLGRYPYTFDGEGSGAGGFQRSVNAY